jgi:hypothetical protein
MSICACALLLIVKNLVSIVCFFHVQVCVPYRISKCTDTVMWTWTFSYLPPIERGPRKYLPKLMNKNHPYQTRFSFSLTRHLNHRKVYILWRVSPMRERLKHGAFNQARDRKRTNVQRVCNSSRAGASCLPSLPLAPGRGRVTCSVTSRASALSD